MTPQGQTGLWILKISYGYQMMQLGIKILFTELDYINYWQNIQDCIWSIRPILKVEILRKLCLKFGKTIYVTIFRRPQ